MDGGCNGLIVNMHGVRSEYTLVGLWDFPQNCPIRFGNSIVGHLGSVGQAKRTGRD